MKTLVDLIKYPTRDGHQIGKHELKEYQHRKIDPSLLKERASPAKIHTINHRRKNFYSSDCCTHAERCNSDILDKKVHITEEDT
jgi:hypothetical protein